MAGASFKFEWEADGLAELNTVFDRLLTATDNLEPLFQDIGEYLLPVHQDRMTRQVSPDGTPYLPLSEKYRESKRKQNSKGADAILVFDDFLRGDLAYQASDEGLELGTNAPYGATHHFGRDEIPARPYLGLAPEDEDEILAIAHDYMEEILAP